MTHFKRSFEFGTLNVEVLNTSWWKRNIISSLASELNLGDFNLGIFRNLFIIAKKLQCIWSEHLIFLFESAHKLSIHLEYFPIYCYYYYGCYSLVAALASHTLHCYDFECIQID